MKGNESRWQQRTDVLPTDRGDEFAHYPYVTAKELRKRKERPRRVKMLLRDFIDDSLYNPSYGYFSKQAIIFTPGKPFDFHELDDNLSFQQELGRRYNQFEDKLDAVRPDETRQLWHTPTELFGAVYAEAMARYLMANYRLTTYPYDDLSIFEMGAGRGTLMLNVLDYIRDADPDVYARTRYTVIEISKPLAKLQEGRLRSSAAARGHKDRVEIVPVSIFEWDRYVPKPCFFLALEMGPPPLQSHVLIDGQGNMYEFLSRTLDPVADRYLAARDAATGGLYATPYPTGRLARWLPRFSSSRLSPPEYIPTRLMELFEVLDRYFPAHRLLASDFDVLPQAVEGLNGPVVQTRFRRSMVAVSTPLVHQGFFDMLFPTDFPVAEALYRAMTGKFTRLCSHADFMHRWADVDRTRTRSGESPLLLHYRNASVLLTV
ncbi:COG1565 domain protein [Ophiocordyceps camponoti-floridani]|uniref:Protein arginine methyltransferase NDUFAF7 n=1 Tax=Ophiocordyceps camponoti-floridani TaxID=2030778 RepID=A0A8H4Q837_9HYPO|nr:COG1565 domain protein [Ophiocordyceps camponoti-floridani]